MWDVGLGCIPCRVCRNVGWSIFLRVFLFCISFSLVWLNGRCLCGMFRILLRRRIWIFLRVLFFWIGWFDLIVLFLGLLCIFFFLFHRGFDGRLFLYVLLVGGFLLLVVGFLWFYEVLIGRIRLLRRWWLWLGKRLRLGWGSFLQNLLWMWKLWLWRVQLIER